MSLQLRPILGVYTPHIFLRYLTSDDTQTGLEPVLTESKSVVLPLHHWAI